MAGSIKLFQSLRTTYQTMGIHSPHPNQMFTLNSKKLYFLLSLIVLFISRLGYFLFEAKFVEDNGFKSFYNTVLLVLTLSIYLMHAWKMSAILQVIQMYDEFIEKSKPVGSI